jgi:hypothetical protein
MKCDKCIVHPERKPRVLEYYDWPEILATSACGCILIACQLPGCSQKMWRRPGHGRDGKPSSKGFYCCVDHSSKGTAAAKSKSVTVLCAYDGKPLLRKAYLVKQFKRAFCHHECRYLWLKRKESKRRDADLETLKREAAEDAMRQMLTCSKCRDVTEHRAGKHEATCVGCGSKRSDAVNALTGHETAVAKRPVPV